MAGTKDPPKYCDVCGTMYSGLMDYRTRENTGNCVVWYTICWPCAKKEKEGSSDN